MATLSTNFFGGQFFGGQFFFSDGAGPEMQRPTGGWERHREPFRDESPEERRKRVHAERIRLGILEKPKKPKPAEKPKLESFDRLDIDALEAGIDLARVELRLIEAEMKRVFPEPEAEMPDKEVRERLLFALEYGRKRRAVLLLLLI